MSPGKPTDSGETVLGLSFASERRGLEEQKGHVMKAMKTKMLAQVV